MDQPAAALIKDLKARGLLDDTIVIWTTEFGRMPCSQGAKGRDHNPFAFTNWLAGGGIKGGVTYGASDEWSYKAADKPDLLLRRPRHGAAPAGHRPHEADLPPQRHRPPADRRARASDPGSARLASQERLQDVCNRKEGKGSSTRLNASFSTPNSRAERGQVIYTTQDSPQG